MTNKGQPGSKETLRKAEARFVVLLVRVAPVGLLVLVALCLLGACSGQGADETPANRGGVPTGITDDGFPYKGSPDAPVKIVEYSDYLCGHCKDYALEKEPRIDEDYVATGKVQYIFHYYAAGEGQVLLGEAAHCAADQGQFWEYHKGMFENRDRFGSVSSMDELQALLTEFAEQARLDVAAFEECWGSHQHQQTIIDAVISAREDGVSGTPIISIQGEPILGNQPYEVFQEAIETALSAAGQ